MLRRATRSGAGLAVRSSQRVEHLAQHDPHLELGERGADAAPDAAAERDPGVGLGRRPRGSARAGRRRARGRRRGGCGRARSPASRRSRPAARGRRRPAACARRRPASGTTGRSRSDSVIVARRYSSSPASSSSRRRSQRLGVAEQQVEGPGERVAVVSWPASSSVISWSRSSVSLIALAVLEAGEDQRREDVVALARGRRSARCSAISAASSSSTSRQQRARSCAQRGRSRRSAASARPISWARGERGLGEQVARAAPRRRSRRGPSVTPKTARRITSRVIACIRGWSAKLLAERPGVDLGVDDLAASIPRRSASARRGRAAASACGGRGARRPRAAAPSASRGSARGRCCGPAAGRASRSRVEGLDRGRVGDHHHRPLEAEEA